MRPELVEDALLAVGAHLERAHAAAGADERAHAVVGGGVRADDHEIRVVPLDRLPQVDGRLVLARRLEIRLAASDVPNDLAQQRWHVYEHDPGALQRISPSGTGGESAGGAPHVNGSPGPTSVQPEVRIRGARGSRSGSSSPRARAAATASARRLTRSFSRMLCTWFLTVGSSICSELAISLFESPSAIRPHDLALAARERRRRRRRALARQRRDTAEQRRSDGRRESTSSVRRRLDRVEQLARASRRARRARRHRPRPSETTSSSTSRTASATIAVAGQSTRSSRAAPRPRQIEVDERNVGRRGSASSARRAPSSDAALPTTRNRGSLRKRPTMPSR